MRFAMTVFGALMGLTGLMLLLFAIHRFDGGSGRYGWFDFVPIIAKSEKCSLKRFALQFWCTILTLGLMILGIALI